VNTSPICVEKQILALFKTSFISPEVPPPSFLGEITGRSPRPFFSEPTLSVLALPPPGIWDVRLTYPHRARRSTFFWLTQDLLSPTFFQLPPLPGGFRKTVIELRTHLPRIFFSRIGSLL